MYVSSRFNVCLNVLIKTQLYHTEVCLKTFGVQRNVFKMYNF